MLELSFMPSGAGQGQIAWMTFNKPESLNALDQETLLQLERILDQLEAVKDLRAVGVRGAGEKAFVAGANIKEFVDLNPERALALGSHGQKLFSRLESLPVPVVAQVQGFALGGGLELALACDFILASENASFALPEITLGIMPGYGGTLRLSRRIGIGRAREMAFTGARIKAAEALQMGLVNHVYPAGELAAKTQEMLATLATRAPLALRAIKNCLLNNQNLSQEDSLKLEAESFSKLFSTSDQKEGVLAFVQKRPAVFKGE